MPESQPSRPSERDSVRREQGYADEMPSEESLTRIRAILDAGGESVESGAAPVGVEGEVKTLPPAAETLTEEDKKAAEAGVGGLRAALEEARRKKELENTQ